MRLPRALILIVLLTGLCSLSARADGDQMTGEIATALGISDLTEALPEEARELFDEDMDTDGAIAKLWQYLSAKAQARLRELLRPAGQIFAVLLLCAIASSVQEAPRQTDYVQLAGVLAISALSLRDVQGVLYLGRQTLEQVTDFSGVLLPALTTAAVAAGAATAAPARYAISLLFFSVLTDLTERLFYPLLCAALALTVADAAIGGRLHDLLALVRKLMAMLLGLLAGAFTLYLRLGGLVQESADAALTKAAKTALSTALPVVGGIVSDASDTLVAGAGILRSTVGVFGMLAILAICASPFLYLALHYLLFQAIAALASLLGCARLQPLLAGIGQVCAMMLALVGVQALYLFLAVLSISQVIHA